MDAPLPTTPRGEQARQTLLQAALKLFGEKGCEGATTREIAQQAGQNIAAIPYYFGSKEGLYLAVAQWIADTISANFTPYHHDCSALLAEKNAAPERYLEAINRGLNSLLHMLARPDSINLSKFMSREQLAPTEAYQLIHQRCIAPLHGLLTRLIAAYTGLPLSAPQTVLHTHATLGNVLAFLIARETIRNRAGWETLGPQQIEQIAQILRERVDDQMNSLRARYFSAVSPLSSGEHDE